MKFTIFLQRIDKYRVRNRAQIVENEVEILSRCSHVNICRFVDAFETISTYVITFEYASNGDLFGVIKTAGKLNEPTAARITAQVRIACSFEIFYKIVIKIGYIIYIYIIA